jgi:hypothetical protein
MPSSSFAATTRFLASTPPLQASDSARRLVGGDQNAGCRDPAVDEAQMSSWAAIGKEPPTGAEHEGMDHEQQAIQPFCPRDDESPALAGPSLMGGTGLEPVTPSLSSVPLHSPTVVVVHHMRHFCLLSTLELLAL